MLKQVRGQLQLPHGDAGLLLCIAAIAFPVSRIPRIDLLAHLADVLLLVPLAYTGLGLLKSARLTLEARVTACPANDEHAFAATPGRHAARQNSGRRAGLSIRNPRGRNLDRARPGLV
jgi:hypothetical protein